MSLEVTYKGQQIAQLTEDGNLTLETAGKYCEGDIELSYTGGGGTISDGVVIKERNANGYATEADIYTSDGSIYPRTFETWGQALESVRFKNRITTIKSLAFYNLPETVQSFTSDIDLNPFEYVTTIQNKEWNGPFHNCKAHLSLNFPNAVITNDSYGLQSLHSFCDSSGIVSISMPLAHVALHQYAFTNSKSLETVYLPRVFHLHADANASRGVFSYCTALKDVQIGSIGYPASAKNNNFYGCTQAGLTIVFYAIGTNVDTIHTNVRNGATNATIIIKAAEATEYNGVNYDAGETIITSLPPEGE